jgi:transposase-like protein
VGKRNQDLYLRTRAGVEPNKSLASARTRLFDAVRAARLAQQNEAKHAEAAHARLDVELAARERPEQARQDALDDQVRAAVHGLYQPHLIKANGMVFLGTTVDGQFLQFEFQVHDVEGIVNFVRGLRTSSPAAGRDVWLSQSVFRPSSKTRSDSQVLLLTGCWVDVDLLHPGHDFDKAHLPQRIEPAVAQLLLGQIEAAGKPLPSEIIWTGGGLAIKWLFDKPLHVSRQALWHALQKHLNRLIAGLREFIGGREQRWPVDVKAIDSARILRVPGTINPKWWPQDKDAHKRACHVVYSGHRHDFDVLCEHFLPYSKDQIEAFRREKKEREQKNDRFKEFDRNRTLAAAAGLGTSGRAAKAANAGRFQGAAEPAWQARHRALFDFGVAVLNARGQICEGDRNNFTWPLANSLAWSETTLDGLQAGLSKLPSLFSGWTANDVIKSSGGVLSRFQASDLYKMKTETFLDLLQVSAAERARFGHLIGAGTRPRPANKPGRMGLAKMSGLSPQEYMEETRARQALAGQLTIGEVNMKKKADSEARASALRPRAVELRAQGRSLRAIARELGVSKSLVQAWTQAAQAESGAATSVLHGSCISLRVVKEEGLISLGDQALRPSRTEAQGWPLGIKLVGVQSTGIAAGQEAEPDSLTTVLQLFGSGRGSWNIQLADGTVHAF